MVTKNPKKVKKTGKAAQKPRKKSPKVTKNIKKRTKTKQKPPALWWKIVKFIGYWTVFLLSLIAIVILGIVLYYSLDLPNPDTLKAPKVAPTVTIITGDGEVLTHRAAQQSGYIAIKLLPEHTKQAIIAIEDRGFYDHKGIDLFGILRAAVVNISSGRIAQGGSTITQQLAKMLYLKPEKKLKRKVQEAILAFRLEAKYDKDKLLELYFNQAYYGAGANGIEAASQKYFDKSARYLNLNESALLAGLVKAPSRYNPLKSPKLAKARQKLVLKAMLAEGYISQKQLDDALKQPLGLEPVNGELQAQYAADWIMQDLRGFAGDVTGDITVETTIDPYLQDVAEKALNDIMDKQAKTYKAGQAALILMDRNGAVRALVGGRNYGKSSFNRVINAKRQPGSVFKPFVYLTALEQGYTPSTKIKDAPIVFKNWRPKNYNNKYYGNVTLTESLAKSMNSVALRLARKVGSKQIITTARRLGIGSDLRKNLSLALGTSEVSLLELTAAYLPFMNGGFDANAHIISRISDNSGEIYTQYGGSSERIIDEKYAIQMSDMLYAVTQFGTGKTATVPNFKTYGKTGTTQSYKDGWFIGYTSEYIAGVWVGNDNNKPTNKVTGGNLPAQIWRDLMTPIHRGLEVD